MSKKRLIIIIAVAIVLLGSIALAVYLTFKQGSTGSKTTTATTKTTTIHTNPDTGEQTTTDPSLGSSESQDSTNFVVYGMPDLIQTTNIYQSQIDFIKDQLQAYVSQNLGNKYSSVTIQPQNTESSDDTVTTTLRLGDSNNIVDLKINGVLSGTMQLFITDPTGTNGGSFTSPSETVYND